MSDLTLRQRFLGSVAWTGASRLAISAAGILVTLVLARLLEPSDYGLLGMAMVFVGLAQQGRELGIGQALVQKREVSPAMQRQAFTYSLLAALALMLLCLGLADVVAWLYDEPRVAPVIRVLALGFPLTSLHIVPVALLKREMRLRGEALAHVASMVTDSTVTITLAWNGHGVWSLVAGNLTGVLVFALAANLASPWSFGFQLRRGDGRALLRFGGGVTLSSYIWYAYSNLDRAIIGRLLGTSALGVYTMAWNLARLPWERLWVAVNPLVLPLFARAGEEGRPLGPILTRLTRNLAIVTFPVLTLLAVVAPEAVHVALTDKWAAAAEPLRWLCIFGLLRSVLLLLPPLLLARGRVRREVGFNAICIVVLPPLFAGGALWYGATGVAMVWAVAYPLLAAFFLVPVALREAESGWGEYLKALIPPAAGATLVLLVALVLRQVVPGSEIFRLAVVGTVGAAAHVITLRLFLGPLKEALRSLVGDARRGARA